MSYDIDGWLESAYEDRFGYPEPYGYPEDDFDAERPDYDAESWSDADD